MSSDRDFVPLPVPPHQIANATKVRGSVMLPALTYLRAHGRIDQYFAALAPQHVAAIRSLAASEWVAVDMIVAHCAACDRLALSPHDLELIGRETAGFLNAAFISSALGASRSLGGSPWMFLSAVNAMRERAWVGGAFAVAKLGPKEALLEWYGQPCGRSPYFRSVFAAFAKFFLVPLSKTLIIRAQERPTEHSSLTFRISWV